MTYDTSNYIEHLGSLCLSARTLNSLAKAGIHKTDYISGGTMSRPIERLVANNFGFTLNLDPYGYFDMRKGDKFYEMRLRHNGKPLFVSPSSSRGAGRSFKQKDLDNVFTLVDGFIIVDTVEFPELNVFMLKTVSARELLERNWLKGGKLNCSDFMMLCHKTKQKAVHV